MTRIALLSLAGAIAVLAGAARGQDNARDIVLPDDRGQQWREYDISPYTSRVDGEKPQTAVVDWVLRDTGTQAWFGETLAILNASKDRLRVYHTPEIQQKVERIVQRMIDSRGQSHGLRLHLITISNPNWRIQAMRLLQPVAAKSAGVDAWLLSKEDAATLRGQLSRRMDYREHNSPDLQIQNGQSQVIRKMRPRTYVRAINFRQNSLLGPEIVRGQIDEGFSLQISPLLSLDRRSIDAVIQCRIDQLEKLVTVPTDAMVNGQTQRLQIEVPQLVSWRLEERFAWPADRVLLLACGVVAQPGPDQRGRGINLPLGIGTLGQPAARADALLFVEVSATGAADAALRAAAAPVSRSRY